MAHYEDYLPIPEQLRLVIAGVCTSKSTDLVFVSRLSLHEEDDYLYLVIAKKWRPTFQDKPYIVWVCNTTGDTISFFDGKYDLNLRTALQIGAKKIR